MEIFVGKILFMKKVDAIDIHHGHKEMHFQENYWDAILSQIRKV